MTPKNSNITIRSFPSDFRDALTILYMQNQGLSGKTPKEFADMYCKTWGLISEEFEAIRQKEAEERRKAKPDTPLF